MKYLITKNLQFSRFSFIRKVRNKKWNQCCRKYENCLSENSHLFKKDFYDAIKMHSFHDFLLKNIEMDTVTNSDVGKDRINLTIILVHNDIKCLLRHENITDISISITDYFNYHFQNEYLYGEYYYDNSNLFHHNFLFANYYEMNITCKKFSYKCLCKK